MVLKFNFMWDSPDDPVRITLEFCSSVKLLRIVALFSVSSERLHGRKSVLVLSKAVINLDFSSFQQVENLHWKKILSSNFYLQIDHHPPCRKLQQKYSHHQASWRCQERHPSSVTTPPSLSGSVGLSSSVSDCFSVSSPPRLFSLTSTLDQKEKSPVNISSKYDKCLTSVWQVSDKCQLCAPTRCCKWIA